ncbi:uncharacterized protein BP5553_01777 [Venustampulla echinocandica]|uniref:Uncharacterized protein n=1 Tax=Venustampulla echinocandica TaxID=2656787 RepID=A0A370U1Z6_9HELO|nr:uncharacterized protein BP5553_01777 [Venustampulla echinocandica]RDL41798.1 hypothetical protein BP5553_01777 [Venustampulla echinocandica]
MRLLATLLAVLATLQLCSAWVLEVNGKELRAGSPISETFSSRQAENGCHDIASTITKKGVNDFRFCTIQMFGCQISFYSEALCAGANLGHSGGRGYSWRKNPVSPAGSKMGSFRITGCHSLGGEWGTWDTFRTKEC